MNSYHFKSEIIKIDVFPGDKIGYAYAGEATFIASAADGNIFRNPLDERLTVVDLVAELHNKTDVCLSHCDKEKICSLDNYEVRSETAQGNESDEHTLVLDGLKYCMGIIDELRGLVPVAIGEEGENILLSIVYEGHKPSSPQMYKTPGSNEQLGLF